MDISSPLVSPIAPSAVYRLPDLDALDALYADPTRGFIYSRDSHPNAVELAEALNSLEGATWGTVAGSGMAALAIALMANCKPGDRIVAADQLYGRTFKLLADLARFGVKVEYADIYDPAALAKVIPKCSVLLIETISNPLMRVADVKLLADLAHSAGAKLVVDNTFATPVVCKPLDLGADLVMESLSKLMNGHSDVMLGYLGGRDEALKTAVADAVSTWGFFASPFDCWLALRGLGTLHLRMQAASENAKQLAAWLRGPADMKRVLYPDMANMLAVELAEREAVNRFMRASPIPFCPSLGHHETSVSYPWSTSHRAVSDAEKLRLGITLGLMRVSVGCEPFEMLRDNFEKGLRG